MKKEILEKNSKLIKKSAEFAENAHVSTNHQYDEYIPYKFHLLLTVKVANEFFDKIYSDTKDYENIISACYCHDTCEDCRCSFNEIKKATNEVVADLVYAVSNEKGKTRNERANDKYYKGIRETENATFIKLCDRIANVEYSKLTKSRMFKRYKEEYNHFKEMLYDEKYKIMFDYLEELFGK